MITYSLNDQFEGFGKVAVEEKKQMQQNDNIATMTDESAKSQDFFQSNKNKKERKYRRKRIKSKKFYQILRMLE